MYFVPFIYHFDIYRGHELILSGCVNVGCMARYLPSRSQIPKTKTHMPRVATALPVASAICVSVQIEDCMVHFAV